MLLILPLYIWQFVWLLDFPQLVAGGVFMKYVITNRLLSAAVMVLTMGLVLVFMYAMMYPVIDVVKPYRLFVNGEEIDASSMHELEAKIAEKLPQVIQVEIPDSEMEIIETLSIPLNELNAKYISDNDRNELLAMMKPSVEDVFVYKSKATVEKKSIDGLLKDFKTGNIAEALKSISSSLFVTEKKEYHFMREYVYFNENGDDIIKWAEQKIIGLKAIHDDIVITPQELKTRVISALKNSDGLG